MTDDEARDDEEDHGLYRDDLDLASMSAVSAFEELERVLDRLDESQR